MTSKRAARCPVGYKSRSYRTDPNIHEALKDIAEKKGKKGGAGQIITEMAIAYIKKETGVSFPDGFKDFYKTDKKA